MDRLEQLRENSRSFIILFSYVQVRNRAYERETKLYWYIIDILFGDMLFVLTFVTHHKSVMN